MQLQDLKRWHWALIGLVLGLAMASVRIWSSPDPVGTSEFAEKFEEQLTVRYPRGSSGLRNIHLHPADYPEPGQTVVTAEKWEPANYNAKTNKWEQFPPHRVKYVFTPEAMKKIRKRFNDPNLQTVRQYLDKLNDRLARNKSEIRVNYRYDWKEAPKMQWVIWSVGGVVVIGGIWPFIVNLLSFGSLFRPPVEKEKGVDLSKAASGKPAEPTKVPAGMSDEDLSRMAALEKELEGFVMTPAAAVDDEEELTPKIRQLSNTPLESAKEPETKEEKAFGGEFYPTVAHAPIHKKE